MDGEGWELLAIFHTHTHSGSYLSDTDLERAPTGTTRTRGTSSCRSRIARTRTMKVFRVDDGAAVEEELMIA